MNKTVKMIPVDVFVSFDGQEFPTEEACLNYERIHRKDAMIDEMQERIKKMGYPLSESCTGEPSDLLVVPVENADEWDALIRGFVAAGSDTECVYEPINYPAKVVFLDNGYSIKSYNGLLDDLIAEFSGFVEHLRTL